MWVPLDIFIAEAIIFLMLVRFIGLWACAFLSLHAIPVLLTQRDPFWPKTLWVNFTYYAIVGNRYLRGSGVTFIPKQLRTKAKPDDIPQQ